MVTNNPLNKYFRQPKIFITLPSKGLFYPPGVLNGDYNNVPIFGMSGMDEILMKTPDALFNGESSVKVIESCCPYITNAKLMPAIDVDAILIAIRIASTGSNLSISSTCKNCNQENNYDIDLQKILDYFSTINFNSIINISDSVSIKIRPLDYEEMTEFSLENFKLQKTLAQIMSIKEEDRQSMIANVYQNLATIQVNLFMTCIETVITPEIEVQDKNLIKDWLLNTDKDVYSKIKTHIENNKNLWEIPEQKVHCNACGTDNTLNIIIDQSSFFA